VRCYMFIKCVLVTFVCCVCFEKNVSVAVPYRTRDYRVSSSMHPCGYGCTSSCAHICVIKCVLIPEYVCFPAKCLCPPILGALNLLIYWKQYVLATTRTRTWVWAK